jgi:mRNA interferase RelE/StbE
VKTYEPKILQQAANQIEKLDRAVARRIVDRIRWLAENLDNINPQPLTGHLAGMYKLRSGDYRVVYEILRDKRIIVIHQIGHRRDIYKP